MVLCLQSFINKSKQGTKDSVTLTKVASSTCMHCSAHTLSHTEPVWMPMDCTCLSQEQRTFVMSSSSCRQELHMATPNACSHCPLRLKEPQLLQLPSERGEAISCMHCTIKVRQAA